MDFGNRNLSNAQIILATAKACIALGLDLKEVWAGDGLKAVYTLSRGNTRKRSFFFFNRGISEQEMVDALIDALAFEVDSTEGYVPLDEFVET